MAAAHLKLDARTGRPEGRADRAAGRDRGHDGGGGLDAEDPRAGRRGALTFAAPAWADREHSNNDTSKKLRQAVTVPGILEHQRAFQGIADYRPPVLSVASGGPARDFVPGIGGLLLGGEFGSMYASPSGDITRPVWAADLDLDPATAASNTSGCQAADYAGMPQGAIVLLQDSAACTLGTKFFGAQQLGAGAIVFFDAAGGTWINVTGIAIPSVAATLETAAALATITLAQTKRLFESAAPGAGAGAGAGGAGGHDHGLEVPPGF